MKTCPKWRKALAYLRLMIRIEICLGRTENPHLLVTSEYAERRCLLIRSIWPRCLIKADVISEELETGLQLNFQMSNRYSFHSSFDHSNPVAHVPQ